jgi:hypothetical protein
MAIYMGEKLAMVTGQMIPHYLAQNISNLLSHRREIDDKWVEKCKECLRYVGKIDRELIYDVNKDYHHVVKKREMQGMVNKLYPDLRDRV